MPERLQSLPMLGNGIIFLEYKFQIGAIVGRYDLYQKKSSMGTVLAIIVLLGVIGAGAWLYFNPQLPELDNGIKTQELSLPAVPLPLDSEQTKAPVPFEAASPATDRNQPQSENADEQGSVVPQLESEGALPVLENSDALFREKLTALSAPLAEWLQTDQLIRKVIVIVNDFSEGRRQYKHMKSFELAEGFTVNTDNQGLYLGNKSYQRYDFFAVAIDAIDVQQAITVYRLLNPLFQQVFAEFSYPADYHLEDLFKKAGAEILAAPVLEKRIELVRKSVKFKFADKNLEALNGVQKQMLRMGPKNTNIIQNKVRFLVEALANLQQQE